MALRTLTKLIKDKSAIRGKTVLVRLDLNVPMQGGRITDDTRIRRAIATIEALLWVDAKVVILSHFGRPKGKYVTDMSLAPIADGLSQHLQGKKVGFGVDCVGTAAKEAIANTAKGEVVLLENLRFHAEEEANNEEFAIQLAELGDVYVNDAFSCSHRSHASIAGVTEHIPSYAGFLVEEEVGALEAALLTPKRPVTAIVGGSKVSTKLALLKTLSERVDKLVVVGGMANTFFYAQGHGIGQSLAERDMVNDVKDIEAYAAKNQCEIVLPVDASVAENLDEARPDVRIVSISNIPDDKAVFDMGPESVQLIYKTLSESKTVLWNGPPGVFEISPFDAGSIQLAQIIATLTSQGKITSIAGGGDSVAVIAKAGLTEQFSYVSTAGGAFLEWLEGRELPGLAHLTEDDDSRHCA